MDVDCWDTACSCHLMVHYMLMQPDGTYNGCCLRGPYMLMSLGGTLHVFVTDGTSHTDVT